MPATVQPIVITPDVDRLQAFYRDLLGAEPAERYPREGEVFFVELRIGDAGLGIVANTAVETGAPGRVLLSVAVDAVDDVLRRVEPLGGTVSGEPNDMPWGQRVAHIRDPDGNAVNLTQAI
ncbi:VOC family protein [Streptomyces sp. G44]|uniref:VOC family protein n=1 Tax=Streptomyces sp. G44 TaxID=2807632 RepID=UPI00195FB9D0|nr:VOC family protein [Streptomyces sp. G44]MBM7170735.1 VOC family protein [Streptomyces sp. G44]